MVPILNKRPDVDWPKTILRWTVASPVILLVLLFYSLVNSVLLVAWPILWATNSDTNAIHDMFDDEKGFLRDKFGRSRRNYD